MPYPTTKRFPFEIERDRCALLVVDMQNDFVRAGAPLEVASARDTFDPINDLIRTARSHGIPVIFTRFVAGPAYSLVWEWSPMLGPEVKCCWPGHLRQYDDSETAVDAADIVDDLDREPHDIVVDKNGYDAFFRTNLVDHLKSFNRDMIVVAGTVTQICVEDTAKGGFRNGYRVAVASNAVSSFDDELHLASLRGFEMKYGRVLRSEEIIACWNRQGEEQT